MAAIGSLLKKVRPQEPEVLGFLDRYEKGVVSGWAHDPKRPAMRLLIEILVDGEKVAEGEASRHRPDLEQAGMGDGRHAFDIPLPDSALDSRQHALEARVSGTGAALKNSPLAAVLEARPEIPPAARPPVERSVVDASGKIARESVLNALSVVIVSAGRTESFEASVRASVAAAAGLDVEFIVLGEGPGDALAKEFPNVRWQPIENGPEWTARSAAIAITRNELVLLQGADTEPVGDFYRQHLNAHRMLPAARVAVLGRILWPNADDERVSFLMSHVQGAGANQFGFYDLTPYTWVDWRCFNAANFSFKKSIVQDWAAVSEDDFAYRVASSVEGGWQVLYLPTAAVRHGRGYSVREFLEQRAAAGAQARRFLRLHPAAAASLGTDRIDALLASPKKAVAGVLEDLIRMIEGAKSWAVVIENRYQLGSQNWHGDLLSAVFEVSYLQGYITSCQDAEANYSAAYQYVLERFQEKMATAATFEVFGRFPSFPLT